jgi:hypothetical protein
MLLFYVAIHGRPHYHGTAFLAAIAGLWIAWPTESEVRQFSSADRVTMYGIAGLLVCLFCVNIWDASVAMQNDYIYPYCGSADAAGFLKPVGEDGSSIFGCTYGMSAVQLMTQPPKTRPSRM